MTMIRGCVGLMILIMAGISPCAIGFDTVDNHTGFYLYASGGISQIGHDKNVRSTPPQTFGSDYEYSYGFTFGHNITNWIAPELQFYYITATGQTPSGTAREHAATIRLSGKISFLTNSSFNQDGTWKFYPFLKVGGAVHGLYVHAPIVDDKIGAWGYGGTGGVGLEINYKALYLGIDVNNDLISLQKQNRMISGTNTTILNGGFVYMFSTQAGVGVHF